MSNLLPEGVIVRKARKNDIPKIARVNKQVFLGNRDNEPSARVWIKAHFAAYPVYHYFVIEKDGAFVGYVGMQIHGGFLRSAPVVEVEQVGLDPGFQKQGFGTILIKESIRQSALLLQELNNRIESHIAFIVWAYENNKGALELYKKFFTDGKMGERTQYGDRKEIMFRLRVPLVIPVRK